MASNPKNSAIAMEIDRLAVQLAKDPHSKVFLPLAEEYCKAGMWQEAAGVLEDGLKYYPGFITAMVVLGRAYDQLGQPTKAKAVLEEAVKQSPENLRAHRTLIKIYVAQGQAEAAIKSCDVILALNPRDEEALSVRAKLGKPLQDSRSTPRKPAVDNPAPPSTEPAPSVSSPVEKTTADLSISDIIQDTFPAEADKEDSPLSIASTIMESALQADDQKVARPEDPALSSQAPPPSPHAGTISQLESLLRSIDQKRKDRKNSGEPSSSTS